MKGLGTKALVSKVQDALESGTDYDIIDPTRKQYISLPRRGR